MHVSGEIPELKWFASKSLALHLLATACQVEGSDELLSQVAALPTHLRRSVLWFLVRTGQPHRDDGLRLTDNILAACVHNLTELDLSDADYLGGITAFEIVRTCCPELAVLDISRWQRMDALDGLAAHPREGALEPEVVAESVPGVELSA